jgi:hypothetical protein
MATVAMFVALGGVGYATIVLPPHSVGTPQLKDDAVVGHKVKDHSLTGADIDLSKLGQVPSAVHADGADLATSATHATTADTASHATTADSASHATTADSASHATSADSASHAASADTATAAGTASSATTAGSATVANSLAAPEAFHEVNTAGQPQFEPGCQNIGAPYETVGFYKDREGIVHLKGEFDACSTHDVFALPAGYRPASGRIQEFFGTNVTVDGPGAGSGTDGEVFCSVGVCSLDGITFRAAS